MSLVKLERTYRGNSHRRIDIGIDQMMKSESTGVSGPTSLFEAYRRWLSVAQNGFVTEQDFLGDGLPVRPNYKIDVHTENPQAFRFNIIMPAANSSTLYSRHVSQIMDSVVAEHPLEEMRVDMMFEYDTCKRSGCVSTYRLTHDVNGFIRDYARLLLPVCDRSGTVTALIGYARHLEDPSG